MATLKYEVLKHNMNGWQKPTKKATDLFCQKYDVSAAWLYTGEGNMFLGRNKPFGPRVESPDFGDASPCSHVRLLI